MSGVALVFPYFRTYAQTEMLFPPLGAAFLAAQLRQIGVRTRIFDCTFSTFEQLEAELTAFQPEITGVYSMVSMSRNTFRIAEMVRERIPDSLLVAGGPMPTLYPERYAGQFDLVFCGEVDLSFPRFCLDYLEGGLTPQTFDNLPLDSYEGLFVHHHDLRVKNPTVHYKENQINLFPLPDRSDFEHDAYQDLWLERTGFKTTTIMTTLGCPFDCDFCSRPVFGGLFRRRNLDMVFSEIDQILKLGYDNLWIADDNFTLNLKYLGDFCERMVGKEVTWSCLSRVTGINAEIARMMKDAGCKRVYLGLETGEQTTLELMNKKASVEEGIHAVHEFRKAGIEAAAFFIVGYPGENEASIEKTFELALSLPLDSISFNVPYPLPGSKLFERVSGLDGKDWDKENEVTFIYTSEFDAAWLERRIGETMQAFAEKRT